jgi:hypothetical protein
VTRTTQIAFETLLAVEECCSCGMVFALPHAMQLRLKKSHEWFYCPAGHTQHYTGQSDAEKAQAEAEKYKRLWKEEQRYAADVLSERNAAQRSLSATKGVLTRTKNRIAHGVCPCCNRSFVQLEKHMTTKHPEYTKEESE